MDRSSNKDGPGDDGDSVEPSRSEDSCHRKGECSLSTDRISEHNVRSSGNGETVLEPELEEETGMPHCKEQGHQLQDGIIPENRNDVAPGEVTVVTSERQTAVEITQHPCSTDDLSTAGVCTLKNPECTGTVPSCDFGLRDGQDKVCQTESEHPMFHGYSVESLMSPTQTESEWCKGDLVSCSQNATNPPSNMNKSPCAVEIQEFCQIQSFAVASIMKSQTADASDESKAFGTAADTGSDLQFDETHAPQTSSTVDITPDHRQKDVTSIIITGAMTLQSNIDTTQGNTVCSSGHGSPEDTAHSKKPYLPDESRRGISG